MSVSANFTTSNTRLGQLKAGEKPKKCRKCLVANATSRSHCGDYCTECFIFTNHKRFSATCGRAGLRKFDRLIVPFDGDVKSQVMLHHIQEYDGFVLPLPTNINNGDYIDVQSDTQLPFGVCNLDIAVQKKEKKPKKQQQQEPENIETVEQPQVEVNVEEKPKVLPYITQLPSQQVEPNAFQQKFAELNQFPQQITADSLYNPEFPFNINTQQQSTADNNTVADVLLPMDSKQSEANMQLLSRLSNSTNLHPSRSNKKSSMHYCCIFTYIDCSRLNSLLATSGKQIHHDAYYNGKLNLNFNAAQLTSTQDIQQQTTTLPYAYPAVGLYDFMTTAATQKDTIDEEENNNTTFQRILPYIQNNNNNNAQVIGSQLLTNATTIPVFVLPFEHIVPLNMITEGDKAYAAVAVTELLEKNPESHIDVAYYQQLYARTYAFYRSITQHIITKANPNAQYTLPIPAAALNAWQKYNPSYYASVLDLVKTLKRALYTQCCVVFKMRAVLQTHTTEDISASVISGLSKARPDMWLPRLVQWYNTAQFAKKQTEYNNNNKATSIFGNFVDVTRVDEVMAEEKKLKNDKYLITHNKDGVLPLQVPYVNVFYESSHKILFLHIYYQNRLNMLSKNNIIVNGVEPQLMWLQSEYHNLHNSSLPLIIHSKNIDRVTMNFIRTLTTANDSSVSNVVKTCEKLAPQWELQRYHAKYTQDKAKQELFYNKINNSTQDDDDDVDDYDAIHGDAPTVVKNDDEGDDVEETTTCGDDKNVCGGGKGKKCGNNNNNTSATQNQLLPVLIYNNSSDGWYGKRCTFCTGIVANFDSIPMPPPPHPTVVPRPSREHFKSLCATCQLIQTDCDPYNQWLNELNH